MATNKDKRTTEDRKWPALRWIESAKRWQVDGRLGTDGTGGGKRETFITREEAERRRQELRTERKRSGAEAIEISTELRVEAVTCARRLEEKGATLTQATEHYLAYLATSSRSILWPEFLVEYKKSFYSTGKNGEVLDVHPSHLADIRQRLGHFSEWAKNILVSDITKQDVSKWLEQQVVVKSGHPRLGQKLTSVSKRKVRNLLAGAYNWAIDEGYAKTNPAATKRRRRDKKKHRTGLGTSTVSHLTMDEVLWPEEYEALLRSASPALLPALILQGFCGIRRGEALRCLWEQIDWTAKRIHIPSGVSKTSNYRYVEIRPAVIAWLNKYKRSGSPEALVAPKTYREDLDIARAAAHASLVAAGAKHTLERWPVNCLRHGFASYYLASELGSIQKLADEMGTSEALIRDTYRQVTTPELGAAFWAIRPT